MMLQDPRLQTGIYYPASRQSRNVFTHQDFRNATTVCLSTCPNTQQAGHLRAGATLRRPSLQQYCPGSSYSSGRYIIASPFRHCQGRDTYREGIHLQLPISHMNPNTKTKLTISLSDLPRWDWCIRSRWLYMTKQLTVLSWFIKAA